MPEKEAVPEYDEWTVEELRAEASEREIEGRSEFTTKADLVTALKKDDKLEATKTKADQGDPPAKRATKLAYPELADPAWLKGNPEAAKKLET